MTVREIIVAAGLVAVLTALYAYYAYCGCI